MPTEAQQHIFHIPTWHVLIWLNLCFWNIVVQCKAAWTWIAFWSRIILGWVCAPFCATCIALLFFHHMSTPSLPQTVKNISSKWLDQPIFMMISICSFNVPLHTPGWLQLVSFSYSWDDAGQKIYPGSKMMWPSDKAVSFFGYCCTALFLE